MIQRLPSALTPLDAALRLLLTNLEPVAPEEIKLDDAQGRIAAAAPQHAASPPFDVAVADGWAMCARDIVGASSYSPLPLAAPPVWVEAGDRLPGDCDCILDADMVEQLGPIWQVVAEATPGHGVRRAGDDLAAGHAIVAPGQPITVLNQLVARAAGLDRVAVRSPRVRVIDVPSSDGKSASSQLICDFAIACGARAADVQAAGRDAAAIAAAIGGADRDLIVIVGGSGLGRTDAAIDALAMLDGGAIHGIAMQPGRTAAVARIGATPVIVAPGAPDQALAVCLLLVLPALDRLAARSPRPAIVRPLARKIASSIGVTEIVLLEASDDSWLPLAVGQLSLDAIARADAWVAVPADSEGFAAGAAVNAVPLRGTLRD